MATRKICVLTASRAEYGLLKPLLDEISSRADLQLQLVVSGTHLSQRFGMTINAIEADGYPISRQVKILHSGDDDQATAKTAAKAITSFTQAFDELASDIIVLLGDRYETLSAATAALLSRLPIAHIHGGELTEGAFDDAIRHAVTKMSHLHFVAAEPYRKRVIQMGESPARVFNVGALGIDNIRTQSFITRDALAENLEIRLDSPLFLITYHPVTLKNDPATGAEALIEALDRFPAATMVFTGVNSDPGHDRVKQILRTYAEGRTSGNTVIVPSLGQERYLSLMKIADVVIGNSSSGLIEAPALGTPTVNMGPRQDGRLRAASIIDCSESADAVESAIHSALATGTTAKIGTGTTLGDGFAAPRIAHLLATVDLSCILEKRFHDLSLPAGPSEPVTVIAEAGVNHNGNPDLAIALIDAAAAAGADIVKFQTFRADALTTADAPKAAYQAERTGSANSQRDMLKALELSESDQHRMKHHCELRGIKFLSTPFDLNSLAFLVDDLGLDCIKIGSGDLTNAPLLLAAGRRGLNVILSTGMATMEEIEQALGTLAFAYAGSLEPPCSRAFSDALRCHAGRAALEEKVTVLQCTTAYPAAASDLNLRAMDQIAGRFGVRVGFSDHSEGPAAAIAAVGRGARLIEKHITLDRTLTGPDHAASMDPSEFRALVTAIREVEAALGDGDKQPQSAERVNMPAARKSLVAACAIKKDELFTKENLTVKRPGTGIPASAYFNWLGRRAPRDYAADEVIT